MTDKDIKRLIDLAKMLLKKKWTKKEAFASLVSAGILTKKGNHTKPYRDLAKADKQ